jgi:hypothetical protein
MLMTREVQRDPKSMISRRTLVHGLAITAGATVAGASGALAQQGGQLGPPTTITSPPRDLIRCEQVLIVRRRKSESFAPAPKCSPSTATAAAAPAKSRGEPK